MEHGLKPEIFLGLKALDILPAIFVEKIGFRLMLLKGWNKVANNAKENGCLSTYE